MIDNPVIKQQAAKDYDDYYYNAFISSEEDNIIYEYGESIVDFPECIYEGFLDDDYEDAEKAYCDNLKIEDIPNEFISEMYERYQT